MIGQLIPGENDKKEQRSLQLLRNSAAVLSSDSWADGIRIKTVVQNSDETTMRPSQNTIDIKNNRDYGSGADEEE